MLFKWQFNKLFNSGHHAGNYELAISFMNKIPIAALKLSILRIKIHEYLGMKRKDLAKSLIYNIEDSEIKKQLNKEFRF